MAFKREDWGLSKWETYTETVPESGGAVFLYLTGTALALMGPRPRKEDLPTLTIRSRENAARILLTV